MFWNIQNIRIGPANQSLFVLRRNAWPNVLSIHVSSYFLVRISSLYIRIDSLYIRTGVQRLSAATKDVAIRCATIALSYWIAHVCIGSCKFLSCFHYIVMQSYWFSITTILLRIASCRHRVASYCISLHRINSCLIRVWFTNNHRITSFWFGVEVEPVRTPYLVDCFNSLRPSEAYMCR